MKKILLTLLLSSALFLASCASDTLKAPCADFGAHCQKTPINVWDYKG